MTRSIQEGIGQLCQDQYRKVLIGVMSRSIQEGVDWSVMTRSI